MGSGSPTERPTGTAEVERSPLLDAVAGGGRGERLREAIYGTIVMLSVLGYLDEHPISVGSATAAVAGSAAVLFLAQAYAAVLADLLRQGRPPGLRQYGQSMGRVWPVAGTAVIPLLLLGLAGTGAVSVATALNIAFWLGAAGLAGLGFLAGRVAHHGRWLAPVAALASVFIALIIASLRAAVD